MIRRVVTIPHTATVLEACEAFVLYRFLAFPVVDDAREVVGVIDVNLLGEEAFDIAEREQTDALFESIGFRVSQVREASPVRAFRFRFPWLVATIGSGTICALLASTFEVTLAKSIVLAFFLTLVLGLGESVSIQSMTVTIQALRTTPPTLGWYLRAFRREGGTALLLGTACGTAVGLIVWVWRGAGLAGLAIGASVFLALCAACFFGLSVPALLHALRLDPKIAAGPVTLAIADIFTLVFYFGLAAWLL
jgi:magnesium transporter